MANNDTDHLPQLIYLLRMGLPFEPGLFCMTTLPRYPTLGILSLSSKHWDYKWPTRVTRNWGVSSECKPQSSQLSASCFISPPDVNLCRHECFILKVVHWKAYQTNVNVENYNFLFCKGRDAIDEREVHWEKALLSVNSLLLQHAATAICKHRQTLGALWRIFGFRVLQTVSSSS